MEHMSKFTDRLEEIIEGAPARMGFGPARADKTPGLALIVQVSSSHQAGAATAAGVSPDGIIISGLNGPSEIGGLKDSLSGAIWGVRTESLSLEAAGHRFIARGRRALSLGWSIILMDPG